MGETVADQGFPKAARLLRSVEFRQVLAKGKRQHGACFTLVWTAGDRLESRLGLTVSRKVGKAVVRNRIKRLVREYFRTRCRSWPQARDVVILAKPKAGETANAPLWAELDRMVRQSLQPVKPPKDRSSPAGHGQP